MERQAEEHGERSLSWHAAGEGLPLDRTLRGYVHHDSEAIGGSTARRHGRFGERLIARLGSLDLRDLREEDVAGFVTAECRDGRAKRTASRGRDSADDRAAALVGLHFDPRA
jgi:hypothetical protein